MFPVYALHRVTFGRNVETAGEQECQEAAFPLRVLATVAVLKNCNTMANSNGLEEQCKIRTCVDLS